MRIAIVRTSATSILTGISFIIPEIGSRNRSKSGEFIGGGRQTFTFSARFRGTGSRRRNKLQPLNDLASIEALYAARKTAESIEDVQRLLPPPGNDTA
jgi:hypothetical protein